MHESSRVLHLVFTALFLFLIPFLAQAEPVSEPVLLAKLRPAVDGAIHVHTREPLWGCTDTFTIPPDHPAGGALYATLLSALLSGRQVRIEVEGTCQPGDAGLPIAAASLLAD